MDKALQFSYHDRDYILEFTRDSVRTMERQGFNANELMVKPMTMLPDLFAGAFIAHHPYTKRKLIDEIFEHIGNKQELIGKLVEMYNEPLATLMEDKEGDEGNVGWTATF